MIDFDALEVDDLITFENGHVVAIRGIIEQEDQRVFQLTDGSDLRVPRIRSVESGGASPATLPTEGTTTL